MVRLLHCPPGLKEQTFMRVALAHSSSTTMIDGSMTTVISTDPDRASAESCCNWTLEAAQRRLEELNHETYTILVPVIAFISLLIVVGVLGNLLVFLVYLQQFPPSATRVFVLALAVCDLLTNVFSLPCLVVEVTLTYTAPGPHYCRVVGMLAMFPILMSYWILACVAFDRRRRICQPLLRQLNPWQATYLLFLPFVLTSVLLVPFMPYYGDRPRETGLPGLTGSTCGFVSSFAGRMFSFALMTFFGLGFSLVTCAYAQILFRVCRLKKAQIGGSRQADVKLASLKIGPSQDTLTEEVILTDFRSTEESGDFPGQEVRSAGLETPTESFPQDQENSDAQRGTERSCAQLAKDGGDDDDERTKGDPRHGHLKRMVFSKTTLMMLVLTGATFVFCVPNIAMAVADLGYVGIDLNSWVMNLRFLTVAFPSVNSVNNPFIYSFCNPNFRLQCRRFFAKLRTRVHGYLTNCSGCCAL